ncbi:MAG: hypothetical protein V3S64_11920 [bacterium]
MFFIWEVAFANPQDNAAKHRSAYAGQERRDIKSLSASDIEALSKGEGWGLAKAAELNGVPGPVHLLELKEALGLSAEQVAKIEALFEDMKSKAIRLGRKLIDLERKLNRHFERGTITRDLLRGLLEKIAQVRKSLRLTHLETHLHTPPILTRHQLAAYNRLRGYTGGAEMDHGKHSQPGQ